MVILLYNNLIINLEIYTFELKELLEIIKNDFIFK